MKVYYADENKKKEEEDKEVIDIIKNIRENGLSRGINLKFKEGKRVKFNEVIEHQ